jgi:uncharacterized protein (DUF885 family)
MKYAPHFLLACLFLVFSCQPGSNTEPGPDPSAPTQTESFNAFLDSIFDDAVSRNPEWETRLGIRTHYGEWTDISDEHWRDEMEIARKVRSAMQTRFDYKKLDEQAQISYRMYEEMVKNMEEDDTWRLYDYPVNQMHGIHAETVSFLINSHRIDSVPDARAYISRLEKMESRLGALLHKLETRRAAGIVPPKFVFPMVISDCRNLITGYPFDQSKENSTIYQDFSDKVDQLEVPKERKEELLSECRDALLAYVQPGYRELITYLTELETEADERDGAWKFPEGEAYYRHALKQTTTTDMSPEEIHEKGLEEVARIHGEMKGIMEKVGFKGDLQEFFAFMRTDKQFYYPNTEEGKSAYLARATAIIDTMRARLPQVFATLPKAEIVVKRVEPYREQSAGKAFYNKGAPDGSRPGTYYANLYNMADMPNYQMEALAYHEGIPGHHMQLSIAMELDGIPKFRRYEHYTAYIEGWGLYSEWLAKSMGFYQDPYSDFGRLAMELWRACRLVVDTGIHWKKWSRQEAIDYLKANTPNSEGDVTKAIERYIVMPSQATAYKIGMMKIMELRAEGESELGQNFSEKQFHDVILKNGPVPLDLLEELVQSWIAEVKSGH